MKSSDRSIIKAFALISQLGISMLTPIFLCIFIGYKLDEWLNTEFWFLVFLVLGIMAAFRNSYYITKDFYGKKNKEELVNDYIKELKKEKKKNKSKK